MTAADPAVCERTHRSEDPRRIARAALDVDGLTFLRMLAYTGLDLSVKFLRPLGTGSGPVRCEGLVVHGGGRRALAEARLFDGAGRLAAHATSSCSIFRD